MFASPPSVLYKPCPQLTNSALTLSPPLPLRGVNDSIPLFGAPKTDWGNLDLWRRRRLGLIGGASDRYVLWDVKAA